MSVDLNKNKDGCLPNMYGMLTYTAFDKEDIDYQESLTFSLIDKRRTIHSDGLGSDIPASWLVMGSTGFSH